MGVVFFVLFIAKIIFYVFIYFANIMIVVKLIKKYMFNKDKTSKRYHFH